MVAEYHNSNATSWIFAFVADISKSSANRLPLVKVEKPEDLDMTKYILKKMRRHLELIEQAIDEAETDLNMEARTLPLLLGSDPDDIVFPLPKSDDVSSSDLNKTNEKNEWANQNGYYHRDHKESK